MIGISCLSPNHNKPPGAEHRSQRQAKSIAQPLCEVTSCRSPRLKTAAAQAAQADDEKNSRPDSDASPRSAFSLSDLQSPWSSSASPSLLAKISGVAPASSVTATAGAALLIVIILLFLLGPSAPPFLGELASRAVATATSSASSVSASTDPHSTKEVFDAEGFRPRPAFDEFRLPARRAHSNPAQQTACPCSNTSLCETPLIQHEKEIFGFGSGKYLPTWDWSKITTVAWSNEPDMICQAHAVGARVIAAAPPILFSDSAEARKRWIDDLIASLKEHFMDGVTFDYELPMSQTPGSATYQRMQQYKMLINETTVALHAAIPGSQTSVCAAWSPANIDGRNYDYKALAEATDLTYIMGYDTQSQVFGRCIAQANAPLALARYGATLYLNLGIPKEKLIMGTPWYGYAYPCLNSGPQDTYCTLGFKPFRGVNCSDAIGRQFPFADIMNLFDNNICPASDFSKTCKVTTPMLWDESTQSPYFNMVNEHGALYQFWFDNADSSALKYKVARSLGLRGVGPYRFDSLDRSGNKTGNPNASA
eukprot:CAMPEP_0206504696 /NCGR_PEP_ID=MMETSP0324_2-20121206/55654_1 /ASSEMBLY_ACC=CAM_ASM_000836 /TAXON_ID=2866 /ORGANISM="Crypthecodinium cohnii, Strain Seligo" /LENGTH=536 /DNA_ID=CAMNT_0053993945 /DNA_START=74 /DNA_END=1680 /DNA_ORIENTATION=-